MKLLPILGILATVLTASPLAANEVVLSLGNSRFHSTQPLVEPSISAEIHSSPFYQGTRFSARVMGVATLHSGGAGFIGIGLSGRWELKNNLFIESSIAPGYYNASGIATSLGSNFEIRSLLGFGLKLQSGDRVSIAVSHKSNASTASRNPGVNSLLIRYNHSF